MERQAQNARARQAHRGLDERLVARIEPYVARNLGLVPASAGASALLHTEPTGFAFLAEPLDGSWRLSGILDFADAMVGHCEYDFVAVALFLTQGDRALFRQFLLSYGYAPAALDERLRSRLMVDTLLHRYSHLPWYLSMNPVRRSEPSLEELADAWFAC